MTINHPSDIVVMDAADESIVHGASPVVINTRLM
jgi:hypothetical protein